MSDIRDVVVPLYERRGPHWKGLGSASIIVISERCAIALTARHVLDSLVNEGLSSRPTYPKLSGVSAIIGSLQDSFIAEVHQIQVSDFADIGFAVLIAPEGNVFGSRLAVDPSPVRPGTSIAALGYLGLPVTHDIDWDSDHFAVRMDFRLESRDGTVTERRVAGVRHMAWPTFKVTAAFDSAMSGGPILELRGTEPVIRGIITSDMSAGSDLALGGGGEAWATEIWPILMMPYRFNIDFADENGEGIEIKTIFDLFREGFVIDRGNSARSFVWETNNGADRARWLGWPEVLEAPAG